MKIIIIFNNNNLIHGMRLVLGFTADESELDLVSRRPIAAKSRAHNPKSNFSMTENYYLASFGDISTAPCLFGST